MPPKLRGLHVH